MEQQMSREHPEHAREQRDIVENIQPLSLDGTLEEQCLECFQAFKTCVSQARRLASLDQTEQLAKSRLRILAKQLDEHRLRMDVWMLDCGVASCTLPKALQDPDLAETLVSIFTPLHANLRSVFREMDTVVVEESTGPDVQLTDSRVAAAVHSIALLQGELANLTSHIEISQAINSKTGPYANIRRGVENIGQRLNHEEQQLIEEASGSKVSSEVESGSSDGEECPDCHQIFPWQIIFFHEENCKQEGSVPYNLLDGDGDANTAVSKSHLALPQSNKTKEVPRAQTRSIFFKLFKSNTELHRAAKKGDAKKIKALLDLGVDINYEGSSGCTALHLATDCSHEAAVRVLLDNGADPQAKSSEGRTPLHSAARTGHTTIVRLLLEKDVDVIAKDPSGSTALHIAAYNGQELVVQILLEKHPFIEVRGPSGFTALHIAAFNGQSAVVRLLVEMGADLEARSDTGRTALQLAAEKGHEAVVRHLLQHGANIMAKDSIGRTALQGAVSNQHGVVAQLLLDKVVPELDAIESPTWSRQLSNAPRYDSSVG